MTQINPESSVKKYIKAFFRILLGVLLAQAGIAHLTFARAEFLAQVPGWLPGMGTLYSADTVVVLSGVVEILLGVALVLLPQRALVGWLTAAFFIAIFPGNISQYVNQIDAFGLTTDTARFVRLFFQPVLVAWALWSTSAPLKFPKKAGSSTIHPR